MYRGQCKLSRDTRWLRLSEPPVKLDSGSANIATADPNRHDRLNGGRNETAGRGPKGGLGIEGGRNSTYKGRVGRSKEPDPSRC